jgi:hypothetical protein
VEIEPGNAVQRFLIANVDGQFARVEQIRKRGTCRRRKQDRPDWECARLDQAANDEASFRDEESPLEEPGGIGDVRVIVNH